MKNVVIAGYARSPFTFATKGELAKVRADEMAAQVIKSLVKKTGVKTDDIEDLILDQNNQVVGVIMGVGGRKVDGMADFLRKVWAMGRAGVEVPVDVLPLSKGEMQIQSVKVPSLDRHDWLKLSKGL